MTKYFVAGGVAVAVTVVMAVLVVVSTVETHQNESAMASHVMGMTAGWSK